VREHLGYSTIPAGSVLGMYGVGAMGAVTGGWAGDLLGKLDMFACLTVLAVAGFLLFTVLGSR